MVIIIERMNAALKNLQFNKEVVKELKLFESCWPVLPDDDIIILSDALWRTIISITLAFFILQNY